MSEFKKYRGKQVLELRPWEPGEDRNGFIVYEHDQAAGSPKLGDMIARSSVDAKDQWLIGAADFDYYFEPCQD